MSAAPAIPGLYYNFVVPPAAISPVRTDVAGFIGLTRRGPVGQAVRVAGWREFSAAFGGLAGGTLLPAAASGYFANGADAAYIIRLLGGQSSAACTTWTAGTYDPVGRRLDPDWPGSVGLTALQYRVTANTPGSWANGTYVDIRLWTHGSRGRPEIEVDVAPQDEDPEFLTGIDPGSFVDEVNANSRYIQVAALPLPAGLTVAQLQAGGGPTYREWTLPRLSSGSTQPPGRAEYLDAVQIMGDQTEPAIIAAPDLYTQSNAAASAGVPGISDNDRLDILATLLQQAEQLHDRLVVLDVPPAQADPLAAASWVQSLRLDPRFDDEHVLRNGAVYHPRLQVPADTSTPIALPAGLATSAAPSAVAPPLQCVPPSGHVAGVISRLDVQRGAYYTPANAQILQAVDLSRPLDSAEQQILYEGGINLLRCSAGNGLLVWGGRVLGLDSPGGFVAHRRLIHLLVRAIRSVAEPLVFDTNGPELWLAFTRSMTTVLLQAFRAGALQGDTPDQAFKVVCDGTINGPDQIDQGVTLCQIQVAPAVPMEFITLRVAVSAQGQLEVLEP